MEFEFDEEKSRANLAKHGIDFEAAQELWKDPERIEIPARTEDEPRSLVPRAASSLRTESIEARTGQGALTQA